MEQLHSAHLLRNMVLAYRVVDADYSLLPSRGVVAHTSDRLDAEGSRATCLAEVGMQSRDRRVGDRLGSRQRLMDL
jgi:hypothetical protein